MLSFVKLNKPIAVVLCTISTGMQPNVHRSGRTVNYA
jgi:hypothetical protein